MRANPILIIASDLNTGNEWSEMDLSDLRNIINHGAPILKQSPVRRSKCPSNLEPIS